MSSLKSSKPLGNRAKSLRMFPFDLEDGNLNHLDELSQDSDTHVSISLNHSGQIAATTMSVRLQQVSVCFHVLFAHGDLHCIHIMTVVKVLLGLRSPHFILIHVDEIHSKNVARVAHVLKVHYSVSLSVRCPLTNVVRQHADFRYVHRRRMSRTL